MKNFTLLILLCVITLGLYAQPAFNWTSQELKAGKNIQKMSVYNNQAVVAGYGRIFMKSVDNGSTWSDVGLLKAGFDFIDLSVKGNTGYLVSTKSKMYDATPDVYTNGIMLYTNDAGATWSNVGLTGLGSGDDPALDPTATTCYGLDFQSVGCVNDTIAYCYLRWMEYKPSESSGYLSHSGIFKTTDKGATWKNLSGDLGSTVISTIAFSDTTGYIGGNKKLYKTSSNSEVLTDIMANLNTSGAGFVNDITVISKDELYVATVSNGIFKSTDGGNTFTKYTISGITGGNDIYKVSDNTLVLVGGASKSRVSNDGGTTWADCGLTTSIWEVGGVFNDSLYVLAKSDIYKISLANLAAGTFTWVKYTLSDGYNLHKAYVFDTNRMLIVGYGQTFKMTSDKGITWNDIAIPAVPLLDDNIDFSGLRNIQDTAYACFNRVIFVDYPSTSALYDIYWSGGIFKTTDNWATYSNIDAALIGKDEGSDVSKNPQLAACNGLNTSVIEYVGHNVLLVWARWYDVSGETKVEHSRVFRSSDGGKTSANWKVVSDDFLGSYVQDIKFSGQTGYVGGNKILQKSVDGGQTFTNIYANLDAGEDDAMFVNSITFGAENEVFITTSNDGVFRSVDGGTTFTKLGTAGGANDFYKFDSNSWIFLGASGKSMFTNDEGANWVACHPGATIFEIGGVWNNYFYALGQGNIWRMPVADLALNTSAQNVLSGDGLKVLYKASSVELVSTDRPISSCRVYSLEGKLVLAGEPASYNYELNNGSFTPGIYIVKTLAGSKVYTNKIVFK